MNNPECSLSGVNNLDCFLSLDGMNDFGYFRHGACLKSLQCLLTGVNSVDQFLELGGVGRLEGILASGVNICDCLLELETSGMDRTEGKISGVDSFCCFL